MVRKPSNDVTAEYVEQTISAALDGDVDAADEALSLFRGAVDHRQIDGVSLVYRQLAEYIAECFWAYEQGATIDGALHLEQRRGVGQPKGTRKVNENSYAALMVLLKRRLGSAGSAKGKILELEQDANGKNPIGRRKLDEIFSSFVGMREWPHDDLIIMLSPAHRRLFAKTMR